LAAQTPVQSRAARTLKAATASRPDGPDPGRWAAKTYNYLRLGMLVAVAALAYSIVEEYRQPGAHCFLGSISGYYYTPVRPIFIGAMVAIGFALIVIKGRTFLEDVSLTLAGIMAPIVAFIPTSDDPKGVCRREMLDIGHYQPGPDVGSPFVPASINNNLHAFVFAGYVAVALLLIVFLIRRRLPDSKSEYTRGFWISVAGGLVLAITGSILLRWAYSWVLDGHARAALLMFAFLAVAAITNSVLGFRRRDTNKVYAWTYGIVGAFMIVSGVLFVVQRHNRSSLGGHLVLSIEFVEISLFVIFWVAQTLERWGHPVGVPRPPNRP
jgi:FtsH-binding integral membrane protein